ncbi:recombinase family protein [Companilactobacillus insicii]|uniref:recombinase family protein n=1 Tax=Companilactobacillus insicii TaxID=1732567 RepID=UPI000F7B1C71|nr:recombinase family protein [Companilactobacillus insicii]
MKWAYCRVSTFEQDLNVQVNWAESKGVDNEHIFAEKQSGKSKDKRAKLTELINKVNKDDVIYIYKLDRLARNTQDSLTIMQQMRDRHVVLEFGDLGRVEDNDIGHLVFTVFSAIAEMERSRIVERTQAGKKYQKEHNPFFKDGRPQKLSEYQIEQLILRKKTESVSDLAKSYSISRKTVYRYLSLYNHEEIIEDK